MDLQDAIQLYVDVSDLTIDHHVRCPIQDPVACPVCAQLQVAERDAWEGWIAASKAAQAIVIAPWLAREQPRTSGARRPLLSATCPTR